LILLLVAAMWVAEILDHLLPVEADYWGIDPRTAGGLIGIAISPFLHGDFGHLLSNTIPFILLGLLVAWRAGPMTWRVLVVITLVGGFGVWLLSPANVITIGASGVVFGLMGYLLAAGVIVRRAIDILLAVGVLLLYGGMLLGATPVGASAGVSWLAHFTGLVAGVLAATLYAPRSQPARPTVDA